MPEHPSHPPITASGAGRHSRRPPRRQSPAGGFFMAFALSLSVLGVLALGGVCWWLWENHKGTAARQMSYEARLKRMEQVSSLTSEDLQSTGKKVSASIEELYSEVDKLWASAWRRNKAAIAELKEKQEALSRAGEEGRAATDTLGAAVDALRAEFSAVQIQLGGLREQGRARAAEKAQAAEEDVAALRRQLDVLEKRVRAYEEWLDGINTWRGDANARLLRLQELWDKRARPPEPAPGLEETPL